MEASISVLIWSRVRLTHELFMSLSALGPSLEKNTESLAPKCRCFGKRKWVTIRKWNRAVFAFVWHWRFCKFLIAMFFFLCRCHWITIIRNYHEHSWNFCSDQLVWDFRLFYLHVLSAATAERQQIAAIADIIVNLFILILVFSTFWSTLFDFQLFSLLFDKDLFTRGLFLLNFTMS